MEKTPIQAEGPLPGGRRNELEWVRATQGGMLHTKMGVVPEGVRARK